MSTIARFSLAEYDRIVNSGAFDQRHLELIRGEIREMAPIGPGHEEVVDLLLEWSIDNLPRKRVRLRIQESIGLADLESAPEPDIAWVVPKEYRRGRPTSEDVLLIIEVAESSLDYDRGDKAMLYAEAGVADYWIVNLADRAVEVHRDPRGSGYHSVIVFRDREEVRPLAFPAVVLRPAMLWE
jgi:Uma2 family endonuclease